MNLTSKRMLQFLTVCASACALSATATTWVGDSFEATDGSADLPISKYKAIPGIPDGNGLVITNFMWTSQDGDASKIVAGTVGFTKTVATPMDTADDLLYLNLETEGQTLVRKMDGDAVNNFSEGTIYVDTLIKFTPSEDSPVITDPLIKAAIFVNVTSNLMVYHGVDGLPPAATAVGKIIDPAQWYRLTIVLGMFWEGSTSGFKVILDGQTISSTDGYQDNGDQPGPWFFNASLEPTLAAIAFQGTGAVDELVVTDVEPDQTRPTSVLLTLSFNDALLDVTINGLPVADQAQVATGVTLDITAIDWYQINSVAGTGITYGGNTGVQIQSSTGVIEADAEGRTAVIDAGQYTGTIPNLGGPMAPLAAWAVANSLSQVYVQQHAAALTDEYLLNVAPDIDNAQGLEILAIEIVGTDAVITVGATGTKSGDVHFQTINGTLKVITMQTLGGAPTTTAYPFSGDQEAVITVPMADGQFMKATIQ